MKEVIQASCSTFVLTPPTWKDSELTGALTGVVSVLVGALGYQDGQETMDGYQTSYPTSQFTAFGSQPPLSSAALSMRRYRQRMKQNPQLHAQYKQRQIAYQKRYVSKMKMKVKQFGEKMQENMLR